MMNNRKDETDDFNKEAIKNFFIEIPEDKTLKSFRVRNRVYEINPATFATLKD
jgi:hypothetical protein